MQQHTMLFTLSGTLTLTAVALAGSTSVPPMPGLGMYIWYDQPVWCAPHWSSSNPCLSSSDIYEWGGNYLCDVNANQDAYASVHNMATNMLPASQIPLDAQVFGGTVYMIAESLTTDNDDFMPWDPDVYDINTIPDCYNPNHNGTPQQIIDAARNDIYHAHASFIAGLTTGNSNAGQTHVPVGLMFSNERTLRWGRWLGPHQDDDGTHWGGRTQLGNASCTGNDMPAPCDGNDAGSGAWSSHWPDNATISSQDDYDITINYTNRVIDFIGYCQDGAVAGTYDFGTKPELEVYLDLELFQLSKVAPSGDPNTGFGCYYPGTENMPSKCRNNVINPGDHTPAWATKVINYWQVPANVADAFWRTLRDIRVLIDAHNGTISDQDWEEGKGIRLTMSVWAQEAYRFVSPRFAIEDTMTNSHSWNRNNTTPGYGMFKQPFGTAQMDYSGDGTPEDWRCDCCTIDGSAGLPGYQSTEIDDFTIINCAYKYADRVVLGTYQSVPAALDQVKSKYNRANMAVDFVGPNANATKKILDWMPGDGIPRVGNPGSSGFQVDFTKAFTVDVNDPYRYTAIGAWPPGAPPNDTTPDWSQFSDCDDYWGNYDTSIVRAGGVNIPTQGWIPFASRFLRGLHRWTEANTAAPRAPKIVLALEMTGLDTYNAGSSTACRRNSYGNQWVWGNQSDPSAACSEEVLQGNLCQSDRTLYVIGSDSGQTQPTSDTSITIGNAWGVKPAWRLFHQTLADASNPESPTLASYLADTPWAMNNYFSYHCLFSHEPFVGTFTSSMPCTDHKQPNTPGWCNNPWASCYTGCAIPGAHVRPSPVAVFMRHDGLMGDVDNDRDIDVSDLLEIITHFGVECTGPCAVDHDGDGVVDVDDMLGVLHHWRS